MDYKIIIILIALLFLMILIYREVNELKDQWNKNMADMSVYLNQNNEKMLKTIQGNMNKYVTQIKGIGSENLQQLGKITLLNHQPIIDRKTANHFTETDISNYMSDRVGVIEEENEKIFEKKENSHYYMSEDTKKFSNKKEEKSTATDENARRSVSEKDNCENGVCKIRKNTKLSETVNNTINNIDDLIPLYVSPEKEMIPIYQQKKVELNTNNETEPRYKQTNYSQINKSTNTLETSMIEEDDYEVSDNNTKKTNDNEIEIDIYDLINGSDIKNVIEKNDNDIYIDDDRNADDEKNNEEKTGEILSSDTVNIEKNISKIDLTNSVNEILNDNAKSQPLNNIDEYDAQSLREMAKKLGIPTTYKEKNKVKQYRKQELYNNILSHLKNKSHQI